jgi:hypothetical protein
MTGFAMGPSLYAKASKHASTPPPDCPNMGTTAPHKIEVFIRGFIRQRNIAGKKLGRAIRDTAENPVGENGTSEAGETKVHGDTVLVD